MIHLSTIQKTVILCLLACLRTAISAAPVPATTYFKVIDTNSGLPDNSVNAITEDRFGFLWVGTWNGLARYDGNNIVTYRRTEDNPTLTNNMVRSVLADSLGVWAGTDSGLDFFRYNDSKFYHSYYISENGDQNVLQKRVSRIMDARGNIYALTVDGDILRREENMSSADGTKNVFRVLPRPRNRRYADIAQYTDGRIMALSNEGITVLSSDGEREICHNAIASHFDPNMNLFCDTIRGRVYSGGGIGSKASVFTIKDSKGLLEPDDEAVKLKGLMRVSSDDGTLYCATDGNGLYSFHGENGPVHYTPTNSSLPGDAIYTVFTDSRHNVWCGTYRHGLCLLSHELNKYTVSNIASGTINYDIVTAVVPVDNRLYIGLDGGGLDIFDSTKGKTNNYNTSNSGLPGNNVVSIVHDGANLWTLVYSGGLSCLDPSTGKATTYRPDTEFEPGCKLWVMADDHQGNLWIGGTSLHIFNKNTRTFKTLDGCHSLDIMSIFEDGRYMWVGTRHEGILQIDKNTKHPVERYSNSPSKGGAWLPDTWANFIFIDSQRKMWVWVGRTLCRIDLNGGSPLKTYGVHDGLSRGEVSSMVEDSQGNLWVGTTDGLFKYIRSRDAFVRKNDSRLPSDFTAGASATSGDTAYFGTTGGLLSFSMKSIDAPSNLHNTLFTAVDILDRNGTSIPLFSTGDEDIELKHNQNFFKIHFSLPEMSNPERMQFECRLDGLEDVWRDVSDVRSATYTNVPPGRYSLLVRHTTPEGTWSEPTKLGVRINPAWYATVFMTTMWIFLGLIVAGVGLLMWRKFIQNREQTHVVELERDSIKRLNDAKLDFYASITHELRTPCFLISAQLEEMLDSGRQTVPVSYLNGIYRNSAKLNKLINHIIDFRKNDTGHLKLIARKTELTKFFGDLIYDYEQLCRQKSLSFTYRHDAPPIEAVIDPDKLELIVTNLISNAYKYTPKGGSVALYVRDKGDSVAISVADTGIGIVDKLQSAIFEPFVRTERGERQSSGDGLGLAFVKELVELHNGTISLESRVNEGSTFTIILPKEQPEATAEHVVTSTTTEVKPTIPARTHEPAAVAPESIPNPTATRTILIIDDNPEVLALVGRAFDGEYRVSSATDGAKGLEMARTCDYDVVITDLMMPEVDGHQIVRELKGDKRTKNIKVVVFSAITGEDDMVRAFDEGADAFLTKPTPLKVLRRQIDRLFETSGELGTPTSGTYNREEQKFLLECRRIIDESLTDENFGIEMLAGKLAMSHSSLYKKIRRMTGMSLIDFINDYRICKAVALFRNGNTNVQRVSELCGFRDIKTFRETFKRKMNMPPKQFMSQLNNKPE